MNSARYGKPLAKPHAFWLSQGHAVQQVLRGTGNVFPASDSAQLNAPGFAQFCAARTRRTPNICAIRVPLPAQSSQACHGSFALAGRQRACDGTCFGPSAQHKCPNPPLRKCPQFQNISPEIPPARYLVADTSGTSNLVCLCPATGTASEAVQGRTTRGAA